MRSLAAIAAVLALLLAAPGALAACPRTSVADLEDEVMCPLCGTPLALATEAPQAERQRAFMLRLVEQCRSKDQIKAALVDEYGPEVLATPSGEGFDLAAWLVPAVALAVAAGGLGLVAVRWRRRAAGPQDEPAASPLPRPEDAARLEADLARYGE